MVTSARRPCLQAYKRPCRQNPETLPKTLPTQPKKTGTTATETRDLSTAMLPGAVLYMCRNSKKLPQTARHKHASLVLRDTPRNTPTSNQPAKPGASFLHCTKGVGWVYCREHACGCERP
jgi:hypothetical protein